MSRQSYNSIFYQTESFCEYLLSFLLSSFIGLLLALPTDLKHSSLSTDSTVCSIRIYNDVLFLSETVFHCFLNSQVDFECWLRPTSVPEPAAVTKMILWNKSGIPRVAGKKTSKTLPPECHESSYTLFDSHWFMYRATVSFQCCDSLTEIWFSTHIYFKKCTLKSQKTTFMCMWMPVYLNYNHDRYKSSGWISAQGLRYMISKSYLQVQVWC